MGVWEVIELSFLGDGYLKWIPLRSSTQLVYTYLQVLKLLSLEETLNLMHRLIVHFSCFSKEFPKFHAVRAWGASLWQEHSLYLCPVFPSSSTLLVPYPWNPHRDDRILAEQEPVPELFSHAANIFKVKKKEREKEKNRKQTKFLFQIGLELK